MVDFYQIRALLAGVLARWLGEEGGERLSRYVVAMMQGLAIQARDGYCLKNLQSVVDVALDAIPFASLTEEAGQ